MTFLAALWFMLHAVASATALPVQGGQVDRVSARVAYAGERASEVSPPESRTTAAIVRASTVVLPMAFARPAGRLPFGGVPILPWQNDTALRDVAGATQRVLRSEGSEEHRLASRGNLLPYDPTAPPHPV